MTTVASTGTDTDPAVFVDPTYVAVKLNAPTGNFDDTNMATPPANAFEPNDVVPFRNTTLPVGTGAPASTTPTVADNETGCPATLNDGTTPNTVVDDALATVNDTGADVDANTVNEPLNVAVNANEPIGNFTVDNTATEPTTDADPNNTDPALNTTNPDTGTTEVTVAVNVTD